MSTTKRKYIYTIGHSTHSLKEFLAMLTSVGVEVVADVRSLPGSRKFPQYNQDALADSLRKHTIEYTYFEDLGGRRKTTPDSKNKVWRNESFRGYADYMETDSFKAELKKLEEVASSKKVAVMCAEAVWWRCHRSMIADILKAESWEILHIMGKNKTTEHPYTQPAKVTKGKLTYEED
ncbi:DUF488 domain-containing protein [Mesonia ostreae]|uniref:DUF488 domain-containing protein n=1 Tax=Mesonia ostreae TaxID=861110 RepID=A0ABU2KHQ3_9FLAO|nr:DUF488 domain-containing protein [Mesonia ostreae]MDT0294222.1 DUF488 domain-containing protein [Mesonia ostreae]